MNGLFDTRTLWLAGFFISSLLFPGLLTAQSGDDSTVLKFRTAALTKEPVPGFEERLKFGKGGWPNGFGHPSIDARGRAAFQAGLQGKGLVKAYSSNEEFANDDAFFVENQGGVSALLRKGDAIFPEVPELKLAYTQNAFCGDGNVLVLARLGNKPRGGDMFYGVFTNYGGEFRRILKTGDKAIEAEGTFYTFEGIQSDVDFSNGFLTFRSRIQESSGQGLWTGKPDSLKLLAMTGQPAPGVGDDAKFTTFGKFRQNANGQVVFAASCTGMKTGIWLADPGKSLRLIAKKGDTIPGLQKGAMLDRLSMPDINSDGIIVAHATIKKPDSNNHFATIIHADANGVKATIQTGQAIGDGEEPVASISQFKIGPGGLVAMKYLWTSANERGMKEAMAWVNPNEIEMSKLIAVENTQAPSAKQGVKLGKFGVPFSFVGPGRIVFSSLSLNRENYCYVASQHGEPKLIAHPDKEIEVRPGDRRTAKLMVLGEATFVHDAKHAVAYVPFIVRFKDHSCGMLVAELTHSALPKSTK